MSAVTTVTIITANQGFGPQVEHLLATLAAKIDSDTGRARYRTERAMDVPEVFVMTEQWDSTESIDAHVAEPALARLMQTHHLHAQPPQVIYLQPEQLL
jgi:quinol monooxygenase YgiN